MRSITCPACNKPSSRWDFRHRFARVYECPACKADLIAVFRREHGLTYCLLFGGYMAVMILKLYSLLAYFGFMLTIWIADRKMLSSWRVRSVGKSQVTLSELMFFAIIVALLIPAVLPGFMSEAAGKALTQKTLTFYLFIYALWILREVYKFITWRQAVG